jgi:hypothetical protein
METRWVGHVARLGKARGVGKPEGKRTLVRPRRRWDGNIKRELQEVEGESTDWTELDQARGSWRALVNAVMNFRVP